MRKLFVLLISFTLIISPISMAQEQEPGYWDRSYDFYAKQGVMLVNSFVGSTALVTCPGAFATYSMWAWSAGTLIHLGVEYFTKDEQQTRLNQKIESLKVLSDNLQKEGDAAQLESLKELKIEHEQMRDFMTARRNWTWAIQIMYDIATILAILEWTEVIVTLGVKSNVIVCKPKGPWVTLGMSLLFSLATGLQKDGGTPSMIGGAAANLSMLSEFKGKFFKAIGGIADGISLAVSTPPGRTFVFGGNAILSGMVLGGLYERVEIAEKNVADIDKVINNFKLTNTTNELDFDNNPGGGAAAAGAGPKAGQIKKLAEVKKIPKCLGKSGDNFSYGEGNCKNPVKITMPQFKLQGNFPTLSKGLALGVDMANAVAAGDMQKAEIAGAELTSMAARIKEIKNKLQDKLNADLKKAGKQPVDFDKEFKQQLANMTAPVSSDVSFSPSLASTPPTSNSSEAKTTQEDNSLKMPEIVSPQAASTETLSEPEVSEGPETKVAEKSLDESLNEFEVPVEDISKESTASLFQQVSNRYLLNYTRFFQQKKSLEEAGPVKEIPKATGSESNQK